MPSSFPLFQMVGLNSKTHKSSKKPTSKSGHVKNNATLVDLGLSTTEELHPESKAKDLLAARCPKSLPRFGGGKTSHCEAKRPACLPMKIPRRNHHQSLHQNPESPMTGTMIKQSLTIDVAIYRFKSVMSLKFNNGTCKDQNRLHLSNEHHWSLSEA